MSQHFIQIDYSIYFHGVTVLRQQLLLIDCTYDCKTKHDLLVIPDTFYRFVQNDRFTLFYLVWYIVVQLQ